MWIASRNQLEETIRRYQDARAWGQWPQQGFRPQKVAWIREDDDRLEGLLRIRDSWSLHGEQAALQTAKGVLRGLQQDHNWDPNS